LGRSDRVQGGFVGPARAGKRSLAVVRPGDRTVWRRGSFAEGAWLERCRETLGMECCARAAEAEKYEELGGDGGGAAAGTWQQVVFGSIDLMETWVAEVGWTCLLLVGNNAAGYTEQAYKVRAARRAASVQSHPMGSPWISCSDLTCRSCGLTGCYG
jgi:hypothetical protein